MIEMLEDDHYGWFLLTEGLKSGFDFENYNIEVTPSQNAPNIRPVKTFGNCGFPSFLLRNIRRAGLEKPTPIQKKAIPLIQEGYNLAVSSQPGSGSTAAYLLPIIDFLGDESYQCPRAVILVPTRELALQVEWMAKAFSMDTELRVCLACGGRNWKTQFREINDGCDILVATLGRLDHYLEPDRYAQLVDLEELDLSDVTHVVIDEAEVMYSRHARLLVDSILEHETLPPEEDYQTLLFTRSIERLGERRLLSDFVLLTVGSVTAVASDTVVQRFESEDVFGTLVGVLLQKGGSTKTQIIAKSKKAVEEIFKRLKSYGIKSAFTHSDLSQHEREAAVRSFRSDSVPILITSSSMGIGLSFRCVSHIIIFDHTAKEDDYILRLDHRNAVVRSQITFITKREKQISHAIHSFYESPEDKLEWVLDIMNENSGTVGWRTLIFAQESRAGEIVDVLNEEGFPTGGFFGWGRSKNVQNFVSGAMPTLVIVGDSGILEHIGFKVDLVINFVLPPIADYVKLADAVVDHGEIVSFFHYNRDWTNAAKLKHVLLKRQQELPDFLTDV